MSVLIVKMCMIQHQKQNIHTEKHEWKNGHEMVIIVAIKLNLLCGEVLFSATIRIKKLGGSPFVCHGFKEKDRNTKKNNKTTNKMPMGNVIHRKIGNLY